MMSFVLICFHVVIWTTGVHANTIYLSPVNVNVVENTSVTLTCSKTNGQLLESRWTNSQIRDQVANLYYYNGQCITTRFLHKNTSYVGVCNGNGTYSVILKRIDRLQHGATWQCKESSIAASNTVTVNVAVPLANVDIYQPNELYLKENHKYQIKCSTSACRPKPTISWYLYSVNDLVKYNVTWNSTQTSIENKNGLVAVESLLNLRPNRSVNGWMLHCEAWTDNRNSALSSSRIALNISYPPDSPPMIQGYEKGNTYRVIESDRGEFSCSVTGGNPLANLSWNCFNNESTNMIIVNTTVILKVTWTAMRNTNFCSCESYHILHGKQATNVTVDVLYPPDIPRINVSIGKDAKLIATEIINIIETETIDLECYSKSRPTAVYTWSVNNSYINQENILKLMHVSRKDAGNYTCHVNNLMNRTFGEVAVGKNSSSTLLNILYPSEVGSLSNTSLKEASTLNITCPVMPGNPATTKVFWTRKRDSRQWNSSQLIILNVSRADDTVYTCTVSNEMIPTIGNVSKTTRNGEFHLNVFYSAEIKLFTVLGKDSSKEVIMINQKEELSFICSTEADPAADISIRSPQYELIAKVSSNNTLSHAIRNTSCVNAGEYICSSRNNYTHGHASTSRLILIVRYKPEVPKGFAYMEDSITDSSVTLKWTPDFNGGSQQLFLVFYKIKTGQQWQNKTIIDTGEKEMKYILFGLVGMTEYQVKMFARNEEGDSDYTESIQFITKASSSRPQNVVDSSNTTAFVAVGAGASVTTLIIGAVVFISYRRLRRRSAQSQKVENHPENQTASTYMNMKTCDGIGEYEEIQMSKAVENKTENVGNQTGTSRETESSLQYESIDNTKQETNQYSQLQVTSESRADAARETDKEIRTDNDKTMLTESDYVNMRI